MNNPIVGDDFAPDPKEGSPSKRIGRGGCGALEMVTIQRGILGSTCRLEKACDLGPLWAVCKEPA